MTLNPPGDSPAKIKRYKTGFILCGLVAVGLIGIQTYRNVEAQNALKGQLARIEANTKTPPKVEVTNNVPPSQVVVNNTIQTPQRAWITQTAFQLTGPPKAGRQIEANIITQNIGALPVSSEREASLAVLEREDSHKSEGDAFSRLKPLPSPPHGFGLSAVMAVPASTDSILSEEDVNALNAGTTFVYFVGADYYTDSSGEHTTEWCFRLEPGRWQPPPNFPNVPMIACDSHNVMR